MKNRVKRVTFGVGLLVWGTFSMELQRFSTITTTIKMKNGTTKKVCCTYYPGESTQLYYLVTAKHLDTKALCKLDVHFFKNGINQKDRNGHTPLHHLMIHPDATIELVKLFMKHGASLHIKNDDKEDPYNHTMYSLTPAEEDIDFLHYRKMVNFVHSEMLNAKLIALDNSQYIKEKCKKEKSKGKTFYRIQ